MNRNLENKIIITLLLVLIVIGISGCGHNMKCGFKPGVTVEQKSEKNKDGEVQKESKIESKLPVKVSPKGNVACSF
jgi:hypothetical protein